jgi:hypothetical protein
MSVIDVAGNFNQLQDCWFPKVLDLALRHLTPQEVQDVIDWINMNVFDAAKAPGANNRMNVTNALRSFIQTHPDWTGTALEPLYAKTGQDEEHAARLYGNLVCRVGIGRRETWWCFPEPVGQDHFSRTYVLESAIAARVK